VPAPEIRPDPECEGARLRVSLALDSALADDAALNGLWDHLGRCSACAAFAAEIGHATSLVRSSPPEPFRCELTSPPLRRVRAEAQRPWTSVAVVVAAVVLGVSQLPGSADAPGDPDPMRPRSVSAPVRLPIGQRSAADDFAASIRTADARHRQS
jgi:hypothetical protein